MNSSLRLLIEDFLGLMREEGELDVFLPLLLSAMDHKIVYRSQKGVRQYGVDISSVGIDEDGVRKHFLWLVKRGNLTRNDWNSSAQSIKQSMDDVGDTYIPTHIPAHLVHLPCKLVLLTNGDFNPALILTLTTFISTWIRRYGAEVSMVNGSALAAWTEEHLLDEHILPIENKILFRRMLANVNSPELCISVGQELIDRLTSVSPSLKSVSARKKQLLSSLRGIRATLSVLNVWAQSEGNLLAPYRLAEYAVLRVWSQWSANVVARDPIVSSEFAQLLVYLTIIAEKYHQQFQDFYVTQDGLAAHLPDSLLVSEAVFDHLGRLGFQGFLMSFLAAEAESAELESLSTVYLGRVLALLQTHSCTQSPSFDKDSTSIHLAMLLLLMHGRFAEARIWLESLSVRLGSVVKTLKFWPMTGTFEDALSVRRDESEINPEFYSTTILLPILLIWSSVLSVEEGYVFLKTNVVGRLSDTTLNLWNSDEGYDAAVADRSFLYAHGVAEALLYLPETSVEFLSMFNASVPGIGSIDASDWYRSRMPYIPLLAALHWGLQIPRDLLIKQTFALADSESVGIMTTSR